MVACKNPPETSGDPRESEQGLKGKEVGKNERKRGPKAHSKNSDDFGTPMIQQSPRVTSIGSLPPKTSENPVDPRRTPQSPTELGETPAETPAEPSNPAEPCRTLGETPERPPAETPAEPAERQISSESLAEGCAPRMVTLRNFRI